MRYSVLLFSLIIFITDGVAQKYDADDVTGRWMTANNESIVEIYKDNSLYYGRFVWFADPMNEKGKPLRDDKNPDPAKRNRSLMGMTFMFGFDWDGKGKWTHGRIYNPQDGRTYSAQLQMKEKNLLGLRGYIGLPALGRTEVWKRVVVGDD